MKRICGEFLFTEAPYDEDVYRATDLVVLRTGNLRIACRCRDHSYLRQYPGQFTIRSSRDSGARTELEKILEGWGDYMVYGIASETMPGGLSAWMLGDLQAFRRWYYPGRGIPKDNHDGTHFLAFHLAQIEGFGVAQFCFLPKPMPCPRCGNAAFSVGSRSNVRRCDGPAGCGHEFPEVPPRD